MSIQVRNVHATIYIVASKTITWFQLHRFFTKKKNIKCMTTKRCYLIPSKQGSSCTRNNKTRGEIYMAMGINAPDTCSMINRAWSKLCACAIPRYGVHLKYTRAWSYRNLHWYGILLPNKGRTKSRKATKFYVQVLLEGRSSLAKQATQRKEILIVLNFLKGRCFAPLSPNK
jgi:hypothetical protein